MENFVPFTTSLDQVETLPLAAQYLKCADDVRELCADKGNPNKCEFFFSIVKHFNSADPSFNARKFHNNRSQCMLGASF